MKTTFNRASLFAFGLALATIASFTGCTSTTLPEPASPDQQRSALGKKIKNELVSDEIVRPRNVTVVTTTPGVVEINGFVDGTLEKERAGFIAAKVAGNASIANNLVVSQDH